MPLLPDDASPKGYCAVSSSLIACVIVSLATAPAALASKQFGDPIPVVEIVPGPSSSTHVYLSLGSRALISSRKSDGPSTVWETDGTPTGTHRLEFFPFDSPDRPFWLLGPEGEGFAFVATVIDEGVELFFTQGSGGQPRRLLPSGVRMPQPPAVASPATWWPEKRRLLFWAHEDDGVLEPWVSDGSIDGTKRLLDLGTERPSLYYDDVYPFHVSRDLAFFELWDGGAVTFWATDASPSGTRPVAGPIPTEDHVISLGATPGGSLFVVFRTAALSGPATVFRIRGSAGLHEVASIAETEMIWPPFHHFETFGEGFLLSALPSRLLLLGDEGPALDLLSGSREVASGTFKALGPRQRALFYAEDPAAGTELWTTDGTPGGTALLFDRCPGPCSSSLMSILPIGDGFVLVSYDEPETVQLFWTYGSDIPVPMILEACSTGCHEFMPTKFDFGRHALVLVSRTPEEDAQLWDFDSALLTLTQVSDFPKPASGLSFLSGPRGLAGAQAGERFVFSAFGSAGTGHEPWSFSIWDSPCVVDPAGLCLQHGRFSVHGFWRDFFGGSGMARALPLSGDTGAFWFFDPTNVEVVAKVLDGTHLNAYFWTFYASLSNVEFQLTIEDRTTGHLKRYWNPIGSYASVGDVLSIPDETLASSVPPSGSASIPHATDSGGVLAVDEACAPSSTRLCLQQARFAVEATWRDFAGNTGIGTAVPLSADTGYFWFFWDANVEAIVKVLDGTPVNGKYWVYYGALSNVEYTLTVTDTVTGAVRTYFNPAGRFASVGDVDAF